MIVERYRGYEIARANAGPWDVTYEWSDGWEPGDPHGYEPSIAKCREAIDAEIDGVCLACNDTGQVRVDPFEPELAPCEECRS